jgi:hypothetical protein
MTQDDLPLGDDGGQEIATLTSVTLNLRGFSPQTLKLAGRINGEVYAVCFEMLRDKHFFVCEEAILRSGHARNRSVVRWKPIKEALAKAFNRPLLGVSRQGFRELTSKKYDNRLRLLAEVEKKLQKGNGHEIAGYGFPNWRQDITQRAINQRRNVAAGFEGSAKQIEAAQDVPLLIET